MIIFCGFRGQEDDATFLLIPRLSVMDELQGLHEINENSFMELALTGHSYTSGSGTEGCHCGQH